MPEAIKVMQFDEIQRCRSASSLKLPQARFWTLYEEERKSYNWEQNARHLTFIARKKKQVCKMENWWITSSHASWKLQANKIVNFCPKIQPWFTEKIIHFLGGWKTRENVVVLDFLAVDNFDFMRKNCQKKFGWKTRENVEGLSKLNFWTKIWLFE